VYLRAAERSVAGAALCDQRAVHCIECAARVADECSTTTRAAAHERIGSGRARGDVTCDVGEHCR
jgi:hypothetical protein